jgi:trehalose-phosphatase
MPVGLHMRPILKQGFLEEKILAKQVVLFLDYDGTLTPQRVFPHKAVLSVQIRSLLDQLSKLRNCSIHIVSGRPLMVLKQFVKLHNVVYVGSHGFEIESPHFHFKAPVSPEYWKVQRNIKDELQKHFKNFSHLVFEENRYGITLYGGALTQKDYLQVLLVGRGILEQSRFKPWVRVIQERKSLEILPRIAWNKKKAIRLLLKKYAPLIRAQRVCPIALGDDEADEEMFEAIKHQGVSIKVGKFAKSRALFYVDNILDVEKFLKKVLQVKQDLEKVVL